MIKKPHIALLAILSGGSLFAQNNSETILSDVTIQAERIQIPFSKQNRNVSILSREMIQKLPAKSVNELLAYVAGIDVQQRGPNGSQADIGIDGGSFDQTLILINGVKMSDPQTGHNMMTLPISIDNIERIEIIKGAAARQYGVNAMMGVINIITKSPTTTDLAAHLYSGSSFKKDDSTKQTYLNYGAQVVASLATGKLGQQLGLGIDKGNGYRYNTAYQQVKAFYNARASFEKAVINIMGGYVNNDFGANLFYAAPRDKEATENMQVAVANINAVITPMKNWNIKPSLSYRYGKDDYIFIRQNPSAYHNIHKTHSIDVSLNNTIVLGEGTLGVGLNYRHEKIESNNLGKNSRENYGLFADYRYIFSSKLDMTVGAYVNHNSVYGWKVYPGLDIGYQTLPSLRLFANIGTGQRLPTYTDLYYKGPNNIGNPNLLPEWATTAEIGARYQYKNLDLNATVFYRNGKDFIDWVRADTSKPWQPLNYASVNTTGINLSASYLFDISETIKLRWKTGYMYLNPKAGKPTKDIANAQSKYAINSLQHQFINTLHLAIGKHFDISIADRFAQRLNTENPNNGYKRKAFNLLDARVNYRFNRFTTYLDVTNILDVKYIESGVVPLPGRWMTLGLKFEIGK